MIHTPLKMSNNILIHNKPTAYLIPAGTYEMLLEKIEDHQCCG